MAGGQTGTESEGSPGVRKTSAETAGKESLIERDSPDFFPFLSVFSAYLLSTKCTILI